MIRWMKCHKNCKDLRRPTSCVVRLGRTRRFIVPTRNQLVVCESGRFRNRSGNRNRRRVGRTGKRARTGATPIGEAVTGRRSRGNGYGCSVIFPPTGRAYFATSARAHSQKILSSEGCRVGLVSGWSDCVGDGSSVAPVFPDVLNPSSTTLR